MSLKLDDSNMPSKCYNLKKMSITTYKQIGDKENKMVLEICKINFLKGKEKYE